MKTINLTDNQLIALGNTLDMVLSITGDIRKGDPDFKPLCQIYDKINLDYINAKKKATTR